MKRTECGVRCFTERKTYCKDLHKWGRNLLYMIGLECVAKQMTEPRSWDHISPFIGEHDAPPQAETQAQDWNPTDTCPLCAGRRFNPMQDPEPEELKGAEPCKHRAEHSQPHSVSELDGPKLNFDFLFGGVDPARHALHATAMPQAALFAPQLFPHLNMFGFGSAAYLQQLVQWSALFNPASYSSSFLSPQPHQNGLPTVSTPSQPTQIVPDRASLTSSVEPEPKPKDEPLDLSIKVKQKGNTTDKKKSKSFEPASSDGVSQFLAKAMPDYSKLSSPQSAALNALSVNGAAKRTYSQTDLDAAVKDIRSGRLGTRRASVVYGIPRSTLRNKIYKLDAAEENGRCAKRFRRSGVCISTSPIGNTGTPRQDDSPSSDSCSTTDVAVEPKPAAVNSAQFGTAWDLSQATTADWGSNLWQAGSKGDDTKGSTPEDGDKEDDWKKLRPKRGQYRKYDKNALDEAVRSVRRGEMSVHRAGSYYGVPHSTLEYKVKERNLLRTRKKEKKKSDSESGSRPATTELPKAEEKKEEKSKPRESPLSREILEYLNDAPCPSDAPAPFSFLNGNVGGLWPSFGATDAQSSFFASEMMRRLQEQVSRASEMADQN